MLPETMAHLLEHGFVRDEKVWNPGLVEALRALLTEQPIGTIDEIQDRARTVAELRYAILGDGLSDEVNLELDKKIGSLVGSGPKGRVQKALENGYVLCTAPVSRPGEEDGAPTRKARGKFVSSDPDVVELHYEVPLADRAVKGAANLNAGLELSGRRIPALATRHPALARKTQEQLALAIPIPGS